MFKELNLRKLVNLDKKSYNKLVDNFTQILLDDYRGTIRKFTYKKIENQEDLKSPFLKDKICTINCDDEEYECTYGNALSICVIFTTLNKLNNRGISIPDDLNDFIFDTSMPSCFENAMDEIYMSFIDYPEIKNVIFESISQLAKISGYFVSGTINLRDIYMLRKLNPEFEKILKFNVDRNETFSKMISDINENKDKLQEFLTSTDSCFRPMILSGSGFNFKQASQIFNLIGPKPDTFGNIHKHPILTNFLNGLTCRDDFYVNCDNCRKALITNYTAVKSSGYLTRILSMLCLDTKLSDEECCNTNPNNLPSILIRNEFILKKYQHRNMWNPNTNKYEKIGMNKSLIGKTIKVASPMTCSCKDGICKNCYGELYKTISEIKLSDGRTIKANVGLIAALLLTEVLTQMLLSTKHLLEANTKDIDWKGLDKYFDIYANAMSIKDEYSLNSLKIKILELDDDENIIKLSICNNEFECIPLSINKSYFKLNKVNDDFYTIEIEEGIEFNDEESIALFKFTIKNQELSDPLKAINSLLNSSAIQERDIDGNINYMMELLDKVGFKISSEHIEVIMRELIDIPNRSDFETANPKYQFASAKSQVLKSSVIKSLLFERLDDQLLKLNTYNKENNSSLLDFLL